MRTFKITTMGCQMNEYDSDFLSQILINGGYSPVDDPKNADLILINTCTVRAKPEQKAVSLLGRMSSIKMKKPHVVLGIIGCLAQKEGNNLMKRFPQLDLVMGPRELEYFEEILSRINNSGEKIVATRLQSGPPKPITSPGYFKGRVTGYISIMEGCNNFCTYCVVPYVRGREVFRPPEEIIAEAESLVSEGVKSITLLGQNVNAYQWEEKWNFAKLVDMFDKVQGLLRLRFTTSHPKDLSDELIKCFGTSKILCPHIHLPFQSGADPVLQRMKRRYSRNEYLGLIKKLRTVAPDIAITSDVMVGFPGESQNDFEMTLDLIKNVEFDGLFSFKYSDRKGTVAAAMTNKVDESEKNRRLSLLQDLQSQITLNKNRRLKGMDVEVLVEGYSKRGRQLMGRTDTNKIVNFVGDKKVIGLLVNVTIEECFQNSLRGKRSSKAALIDCEKRKTQ